MNNVLIDYAHPKEIHGHKYSITMDVAKIETDKIKIKEKLYKMADKIIEELFNEKEEIK